MLTGIRKRAGSWQRRRLHSMAGGLRSFSATMTLWPMARGEAIDAAGRKTGKDIYLVGVDALEETVQYIKEGKVTGTVLNDQIGRAHV